MKKILMTGFVALLALGLNYGEAEAARMGGGKSVGMQRQSVAPKPATPAQAAPAPVTPSPAAAPAAAPKRNWLGPIAGLAAGLGIAALLSHFGMGAGMANFLMIALLAMAAFFIFKLVFRRNPSATQQAMNPAEPMRYAGAGNSGMEPPPQPVFQPDSVASVSEPSIQRIPEGFDAEGFLRVAKLNFVRLQAANDAKNLEDIREFTCPELFAEIKMQMDERGNGPQQTDVVTLEARLLEVSTEGNQHIASVHFSGMIRETAGATAASFDEIWNLNKSTGDGKGWVIAGIQQVN